MPNDLFLRDLKLSARSLLGRPAFALIVVLTLGLGLGATAILLSVADAVLLRPLPYPEPDRLVSLYETVDRDGVEQRRTFSYPDFLAVRDKADAFESMAVIENNSVVLRPSAASEDGQVQSTGLVQRLRGAWVSPAYFDVLGVAPRLGRAFAPEPASLEESVDMEVVLSHRLWQNHFASRADVLGETAHFDGESYRVIGVMPESFAQGDDYDVYFSALHFAAQAAQQYQSRSFGVIARLAPGQSIEQAQTQVETIFAGLEEAWPESNIGYSGGVVSLHRDTIGDLRRPVMLLGGAVALLLLLSGFNVANMMLVEALRRRRGAAIRLALGASHWHLFRQTLIETLLLAVSGAGLGLLVAAWGLPLLDQFSPVRLPAWAALDVNARVASMTFGAVVALGSALAAIVAWQGAGRRASLEVTRQGSRTVGDLGGDPLRRLLLGAQIALAFVVAVGAVLLSSSFYEWSRIDPGFSERELVFFRASLPSGEPEQTLALHQELLEKARSVTGVRSVALASDLPLEGGYSATVVAAEGARPQPDDAYGGGHRTYHHFVSEDYFSTLGLPILRGRSFDGSEPLDGDGVAVVSQELANRLWPVGDALGRRLRFGPPSAEIDEDTLWVTVIGIAGEVRHRNLRADPQRISEDPDLYLSLRQFPRRQVAAAVSLASATEGQATKGQASERLIAVRQAMEPLQAKVPFFAWRTLDDNLARELRTSRFSTLMMSVFAGLALLLAAIGVYGVFSHRVQERRREIGVRMALGAYRDRIVGWLLRDAAVTIGIGVAAGAAVALALTQMLKGVLGDLLYGVAPNDLRLFAAVAVLVVASALLACLLPARQATRVDPQIVLREE